MTECVCVDVRVASFTERVDVGLMVPDTLALGDALYIAVFTVGVR